MNAAIERVPPGLPLLGYEPCSSTGADVQDFLVKYHTTGGTSSKLQKKNSSNATSVGLTKEGPPLTHELIVFVFSVVFRPCVFRVKIDAPQPRKTENDSICPLSFTATS